ncbi:unnamed protein product [Rangifer tarandus platyrhynchus]|uniref:Uncharacterized protein n=1 Tax=Rangifer tarandus platyrhynchus TaxID=3082113 RepID=A0AC59ZQH8_RANTA
METEAGEASDFQERRLVPLAGFTQQPFLFRENASFHMFPETGSSGQGLLPKTSAISHMDRWEFCFFRLRWESFEPCTLTTSCSKLLTLFRTHKPGQNRTDLPGFLGFRQPSQVCQ